ncbi:hypothetical protein PENSPDRAFT_501048 [Peniophora sp. CONT]|nr:hypothetical protein PENSPDRAFT_501048 [Peniophora sp. CONT]
MSLVILDSLVGYENGSAATMTYMTKEVVTILRWVAEPEHDERKKAGIKAAILFTALTAISI